jgi:glutamate-1-semialdehyde 2,1-aminomutase
MIAFIQARIDSKRLPKKVLYKIQKETIIEIIHKRLKKSKYISKIIFIIPNDKKNLILEKKLKYLRYEYFKGSNLNVLKRYYDAAKYYGSENLIRITSDCPLIDSTIIDKMILVFKKNNLDYLSNNNPPSFPHGLDVEIIRFDSLKNAYMNAKSLRDKEHVTYYITRNKKKFKIKNYKNKKNFSKIRVTLDYIDDFIVIKNIFNHFHPNFYFKLNDIEKLYLKKPQIFSENLCYT